MPLEPLDTWQQTLKQLEQVGHQDWAQDFSQWLSERSTSKLQLMPVMGPVSFTFQKSVFEARLREFRPVGKPREAALAWAGAWEAAVNASAMVVGTGAFLGAPVPVTMWAVATAVIDASSVQAGKKVLIQKLSDAKFVAKAEESEIAEAFRMAFLTLTATVTGVCMTYPPAPLVGPLLPTA